MVAELQQPTAPAAEFPEALEFLFEAHRFKVAWGGRGAAKSWSFAAAILIQATAKQMRVFCGRETMKSVGESVHPLLQILIEKLGLPGWHVEKVNIWHDNGSEISFGGLRHNVHNIKGLESIDICWLEEAANVSKDSWDTLIPTIRKKGSEIWVSFNPVLETDATYQRFVLNSRPDAHVVKISWRDNPWFFTETELPAERLEMLARDPAGYQHVWEGECRSTVEGAIFGAEMAAAEADGRIRNIPIDRTKPVTTVWDLGFGDKTAIWFVQVYDGWYNLVDYLEDNGRTIEWYLIQLQQKGYLYGEDWLPHDGVDTIIHHKLAAGDRSRSIESIMRGAGRSVRIVPKLYVADRINAARTIFPQCRFNRDKCDSGLRALRMYQWGEVTKKGIAPTAPLHDDASHGADAFCGLAVAVRQTPAPKPKQPPKQVFRPQAYMPFAG